ncbi:hypothetical protein JR316_0006593 [Psilocybe cubensis]|uniref:Uncharacterized protein n=1 Tax=Psilocybe cubensis TaxID=181762 RepID=A0ACB8GXQ0_PSICU|nr:hypothetical protein JR316_0006593 [Psilocybe cubensis]KAH9479996.1 hypothetical protein JR316_0006593 [Psilocybe cubensis]
MATARFFSSHNKPSLPFFYVACSIHLFANFIIVIHVRFLSLQRQSQVVEGPRAHTRHLRAPTQSAEVAFDSESQWRDPCAKECAAQTYQWGANPLRSGCSAVRRVYRQGGSFNPQNTV